MSLANTLYQSPTQAWSAGCLIDLYMDAAEEQGYDSADVHNNSQTNTQPDNGKVMGLNIPEVMEKVIEKTKKVL